MIDWISAHGNDIMAAVGYLVAFASIIVGMFKSERANSILGLIIKVLDTFSVVNPRGTRVLRNDSPKDGK